MYDNDTPEDGHAVVCPVCRQAEADLDTQIGDHLYDKHRDIIRVRFLRIPDDFLDRNLPEMMNKVEEMVDVLEHEDEYQTATQPGAVYSHLRDLGLETKEGKFILEKLIDAGRVHSFRNWDYEDEGKYITVYPERYAERIENGPKTPDGAIDD